jgi:hypothetical protein
LTLDQQNDVRSLVGFLNRIQSNEYQHPSLQRIKPAQFTDPQAKTLVEILQAGSIVESGAIEGELQRIEDELQRIEDYLLADPFEPFAIETFPARQNRRQTHYSGGFLPAWIEIVG